MSNSFYHFKSRINRAQIVQKSPQIANKSPTPFSSHNKF